MPHTIRPSPSVPIEPNAIAPHDVSAAAHARTSEQERERAPEQPPEHVQADEREDVHDRVTLAVAAARAAAPAWAARAVRDRVAVLERFRALVFAERDAIARTISEETGKPLVEALIADVSMALEGARFLSRVARRTLASRRMRSRTLAAWRKIITVHHDPLGVVGIVSPWNYPFFFPAMHAMTALVAGNVVLLKPSEYTPRSADHLARLLARAGVPEGVFTLLQGAGGVGAALVASDLDKLFFTGSGRTGALIAAQCAPRFVPVSLELGGSDAAVVLDDAPVAFTASGILWGRFTNAGQTCAAVKRVVVMDAIHDELVSALVRGVQSLALDAGAGTRSPASADAPSNSKAPFDVGPLISTAQRTVLMSQLDDAIARGATVSARRDPAVTSPSWRDRGAPLVVLTDVTPDMRVWHEETCGPLLVVVRARTEGEAIRLANDTRYGLGASVWSRDRARANRVGSQLVCGAVVLNDSVISAGLAEVPHGGVRASGIGRIHGVEGLLECVRTRTVIDDLLPVWRQAWWFGYDEDGASRIDAYLRLTHGASWRERISGLAGTVRLVLFPSRPL